MLALGIEISEEQVAQYGELVSGFSASEPYGGVRPLRRAIDPEVDEPIRDPAIRAQVMQRFRDPEVYSAEDD